MNYEDATKVDVWRKVMDNEINAIKKSNLKVDNNTSKRGKDNTSEIYLQNKS